MKTSFLKIVFPLTLVLIISFLFIVPGYEGRAYNPLMPGNSTSEEAGHYQQDIEPTTTPALEILEYSETELEEEQPYGIIIGAGLLVLIIYAGTFYTIGRGKNPIRLD